MKENKKRWILAGIAAVLLIFIIVATLMYRNNKAKPQDEEAALASYLIEQDSIMTNMVNSMEITPTTNADLDFLYGMISHHKAAIEMSKNYLNTEGSNRKLKKIAKTMIKKQTKEISEMQKTAARLEQNGISDTATEEAYLSAYNEIMSKPHYLEHGTDTSQNIDQAFAEGMIMHHEMAVEIALAILTNSTNDDIHDYADNILKMQEEEISTLKTAFYSQETSTAGN